MARASAHPYHDTVPVQVEQSQQEARAAKRNLTAVEAEANEKVGTLSALNASLSKDVADLRARQAPMLAEVEAARVAMSKLQQEADDARKLRAEAVAKLDKAANAVAQSEANIRELRASEGKLLRALEDADTQIAALQTAAAKDAEILTLKDGEVLAAQQRAIDASTEVRRLVDENNHLRRDVESLGYVVWCFV